MSTQDGRTENDKSMEMGVRQNTSDSSSSSAVVKNEDVDVAWDFLNKHRNVAKEDISIDLAALRHKIDWHIVPLMFCCYTLQFIDKVILNVSLCAVRTEHQTSCYYYCLASN